MKLYSELATWWPLFSPADDFAEEAALFRSLILENSPKTPHTLLELGSGTGNNAFHLKSAFTLTLTDISAQMLEMNRTQNPESEHIIGDMRTLRLERRFDVIFVHDAVMYMTAEADLRQAIETASIHCAEDGIAVFVPDYTVETFVPTTRNGGTDGNDGRAIRYLIWDFDLNPLDTVYSETFSMVLREPDGSITFESEESLCGIFPRNTWEMLLVKAGFSVKVVRDPYGRDIFIGRNFSRRVPFDEG